MIYTGTGYVPLIGAGAWLAGGVVVVHLTGRSGLLMIERVVPHEHFV